MQPLWLRLRYEEPRKEGALAMKFRGKTVHEVFVLKGWGGGVDDIVGVAPELIVEDIEASKGIKPHPQNSFSICRPESGHKKANTGHAEMCSGNRSQALGSYQDDRCKEPKFVVAGNLLHMQTPISGNNTSRSQAQEGSHNSIVPAQDGFSRILSRLGNNQLPPEEQRSESETTIQDHCIVDIASTFCGANFQAGTFGTQNPTDGQYWLKISKILIPISAGAVYNSSSMFAKAANTLAFMATLAAIFLRPTWSRAIRISTKFGAIACAAGTLAAIGHDLPDDYRWVSGVAFLIPAIAIAVA